MNSTIVMVMGEALLILFVVCIVMVVLAMKRKASDRKAAELLIKKLKKDRSARREKFRCLLNGKYHYQDDQLDQAVRDLSKSEAELYQEFIDIYLGRDSKRLGKLDQKIEAATEHYFGLELPVITEAETSEADDSRQITRLEAANKKLKEELAVSMDTLGRMLSEYSDVLKRESQQAEGEACDETPATENMDDEQPEANLEETPVEDAVDELPVEKSNTSLNLAGGGLAAMAGVDSDGLNSPVAEETVGAAGDENLEASNELGDMTVDSINELLNSVEHPEEEPVTDETDQESVEPEVDELPENVLDELEEVASQIDGMAINEVDQASENVTAVDDIDELLASVAEVKPVETAEPAVEVNETPDPDEILEELQKAQALGQEIDELIDQTQVIDDPSGKHK